MHSNTVASKPSLPLENPIWTGEMLKHQHALVTIRSIHYQTTTSAALSCTELDQSKSAGSAYAARGRLNRWSHVCGLFPREVIFIYHMAMGNTLSIQVVKQSYFSYTITLSVSVRITYVEMQSHLICPLSLFIVWLPQSLRLKECMFSAGTPVVGEFPFPAWPLL